MSRSRRQRPGNRESGRYTTREEFQEIISRIRDGDIPTMKTVEKDWPTQREWVVKILEAFLAHLEVPKPRNPVLPLVIIGLQEKAIYRAGLALEAVCHVATLKDSSMLELIGGNIDAILSWHGYLFHWRMQREETFVTTVGYLMTCDTKLQAAVLSSPWIGPCLVTLIERFSVDEPADELKRAERRLSSITLLYSAFIHQVYRFPILDHFAGLHKSRLRAFVKNIVDCIDSLRSFSRLAPTRKHHDLKTSIMHVQKVIDVLSWDSRFRRCLIKEDYIFRFFTLLRDARPQLEAVSRIEGRSQGSKWLWNGLNLHAVCDWANHNPRSASQTICKLIELGYLTLVVDDLTQARRESDTRMPFNCLLTIVGHLRSQRVLDAANSAWENLPPAVLQRLEQGSTTGAKLCGEMNLFLTLHNSTLGRIPEDGRVFTWVPPNYCHYIQGPHVEIVEDHSDMRTCSRCQSVVYCCEECQADDWEALHKFECSMLSRSRRVLKETGFWMPWRQRFRTLDVISNLMDALLREGMLDVVGGGYGNTSHPVIDSKACVRINYKMAMQKDTRQSHETITIDEYRERAKKMTPWLPLRFEALVSEVMEDDGSTQLVSFVFPFAHSRLHALFLYDKSDEFDDEVYSRLGHGMMQFEYSSGTMFDFGCDEPCCKS
ncbi:hypothetical protein CC2G_009806 [Coprinopsis cinerea AmutBmut pab1-1]|nr:hypothetical protein CC2G_009806 [Coprinopsis cinerea AmutBmut pab1-1]